MRNDDVKPDWHCVGFDHTKHFRIQEEDKPYIEKIVGAYFFDRNSYTYCCEITPSYDMRFLHHSVHFRDADTPDEIKDRIHERYEYEYAEDCYMHVRDVKDLKSVAYGEVDEDTTEDDVREYWQSNHPDL